MCSDADYIIVNVLNLIYRPRTPDLPIVDMFLQAHPLHRVEIKHELMISQLGPTYSKSNEKMCIIEIYFVI